MNIICRKLNVTVVLEMGRFLKCHLRGLLYSHFNNNVFLFCLVRHIFFCLKILTELCAGGAADAVMFGK